MSRSHFPDRSSLHQFDNLSTPVWIFDVERHGIWWGNAAGIAFWQANSLDDLLARDFSDDSATVRMRLRQIIESSSGSAPVQDTWTLYPKGKPRTVVISFQPIVIEDGVDALMLEVNRVVDVRADEEAIRMLEAIKTAALIVSTYTSEGHLLAQNPEALACYGRGSTSHRQLDARLLDQDFARQLREAVVRNQVIESEQCVATLQGPRRHRIFARRGRDPITGEFVIVVSEEDVTEQVSLREQLVALNERLEAEVAERTKRLSDSEERYAMATRNAAIWDWHLPSDKVFVSPRFIQSIGYDQDAFYQNLTRAGSKFFVQPEEVDRFHDMLVAHLKNPEDNINFEARFVALDGTVMWYNLRGIGVRGPDGRTVRSVGLLTDITERKQLEVSLFAAQRLEAVGQLTGGIAHDFNNLLTVIGGNSELLALSCPQEQDLTQAIAEAVQRGSDLTRHLLAFSGKQALRPVSVNVATLVLGMRMTLLPLLGEEVEIATSFDQALWEVRADPAQFESAVLNVALNARDALLHGGKLTIHCANLSVPGDTSQPSGGARGFDLPPGDYVEIQISDCGTGMPPDVLAKAVEPFFTTKEIGKGSGLGLSLVFGFARQSGGDLWIESALGHGTTVHLYLPRSLQPPETMVQTPEQGAQPGKGELILLVEDNPHVQNTMSRILKGLGYAVETAASVEQASHLLDTGCLPDLFLLDVVLPGGKSGLEFAKELKCANRAVRILLVSGYPDLADAETIHTHVDAFLQKPFGVPLLSKTLRSILDA